MPNRWEMPPVYLQSGDPETENTPTLHAPGLLGARFTVVQPNRGVPSAGGEDYVSKRYQLIRTDSTMSVAPYKGASAWWADKAAYLVTTDPTYRNRVAGVFQNVISPGYYGCVQIGGPATVKLVDAVTAAVAIGTKIIPSATAGKADNLAVGTAPTHVVMGYVSGPPLVYNAASQEVQVDLDIPETT